MLMLEFALQSSAFILLLFILRPMFKKLLSARARYALWLIPFLRLAIPLSITSQWSIWNYIGVEHISTTPMKLDSSVLPVLTTTSTSEVVGQVASQTVPGLTSVTAITMNASSPMNWSVLLPQLATWAWMAGVVVMLAWMLITNYHFYRVTRKHKQLMTFGFPLPIHLVEGLPSPCLVGIFRPRILVNRTSMQSKEMLDMVILHEMTHYRHGDHLWTMLRALLLCIWWWNPLMWVANKYSKEDCEAACDEAVIRKMTGQQRQAYGMSLIELMRHDAGKVLQLNIGTSMSSGKKQMEERIKMIRKNRLFNKKLMVCIMLCLFLFVPMLMTNAIGNPANLKEQHIADIDERYEKLKNEMENTYGEYATWSIEVKAELDKLLIDENYPIGDDVLNVLPGPEDVSQQEALIFASNEINKEFSLEISPIDFDTQLSFFYIPIEDQKLWVIEHIKNSDSGEEKYIVEFTSPDKKVILCAYYVNGIMVNPLQADGKTGFKEEPLQNSIAVNKEVATTQAIKKMKAYYGFEDNSLEYFDSTTEWSEEKNAWLVTFKSTYYNPSKVGTYVFIIDGTTGELTHNSWDLEKAYQKQGPRTPWKLAELWSSYEYNQYSALKIRTNQIIEQAGGKHNMSFEQQAAYDTLYRDAGYDRNQYYRCLPSSSDASVEIVKELIQEKVSEKYGITSEQFRDAQWIPSFDVSNPNEHRWKVILLLNDGDIYIQAETDASGVTILNLVRKTEKNG